MDHVLVGWGEWLVRVEVSLDDWAGLDLGRRPRGGLVLVLCRGE